MSPQDDSSLLRPMSAASEPPVATSQPSVFSVSVAPGWTEIAVRPSAPVRLQYASSRRVVETSSVVDAPGRIVIGVYPARPPGSMSSVSVTLIVLSCALTKIGAKPCMSLPLMSYV